MKPGNPDRSWAFLFARLVLGVILIHDLRMKGLSARATRPEASLT